MNELNQTRMSNAGFRSIMTSITRSIEPWQWRQDATKFDSS
jgi:hypothetical protein